MRKYGGTFHCICGDFKWHTYELEPADVVVDRLDKLTQNCVDHRIVNGVCHAIVKCPICSKKFSVQDPECTTLSIDVETVGGNI